MTTALPPPLPSWLDRQEYPFSPRSLATPEGRLSYLDEGRGPPILLVHGTPSWSFEWRGVIAALAATHRCIAPDHLGFGLSDKPTTSLRPEDHARRLKELVLALDLRELTLVVHDFGGPIGLPLALDLPERVSRVVVLNTWMWPNSEDQAVARIDRLVRSWLGRVLYRWLNFSPRVLLPAAFSQRRLLSRAAHRHYLGPFGRRADREAPYALAQALCGSDAFYASLWDRRAELAKKPLNILWGERDPAFTLRHLQRWQEAFPKAQLRRLPNVGHFLAEEAPGEVARELSSLAG
jgi:haloalkane dehalogenase